MGSLKTHKDMYIYNTYTKLSEEWKSIKSSQPYGTGQGRIYTIQGDKIHAQYTQYEDFGDWSLPEQTLFFVPKTFPCLVGYQVFFYRSDGRTTFDPTIYYITDSGGAGNIPLPIYDDSFGQYVFKKQLRISSSGRTFVDEGGHTTVVDGVEFYYQPIIYSTSNGIIKLVSGYV